MKQDGNGKYVPHNTPYCGHCGYHHEKPRAGNCPADIRRRREEEEERNCGTSEGFHIGM